MKVACLLMAQIALLQLNGERFRTKQPQLMHSQQAVVREHFKMLDTMV